MFDQSASQVQAENLNSATARLEEAARMLDIAVFGDGPRVEEVGANPASNNKFVATKERINRATDKIMKLAMTIQDA